MFVLVAYHPVIYVVHKRPAPYVYMGIMEINAPHVYLPAKIVVP